jgi:hypothetical protein
MLDTSLTINRNPGSVFGGLKIPSQNENKPEENTQNVMLNIIQGFLKVVSKTVWIGVLIGANLMYII